MKGVLYSGPCREELNVPRRRHTGHQVCTGYMLNIAVQLESHTESLIFKSRLADGISQQIFPNFPQSLHEIDGIIR